MSSKSKTSKDSAKSEVVKWFGSREELRAYIKRVELPVRCERGSILLRLLCRDTSKAQ